MKIAICDDEREICEEIRDLLFMYGRKDFSVELFESGDALLSSDERFDLIFLDIQMTGTNGIETARIIREIKESTVLIFITGIKEYVFDAFDVRAFHYLLKPVDKEKFVEVFGRAVEEAKKNMEANDKRTLHIKTRTNHFTIEHKSILYLENQGRKVKIHTGEKVIEVYAVMNELEQQLGKGFYRCHRGYLVNMDYISEYDHTSIMLRNGESVYLAKERYGEFIREYMRYLKSGGASGV
ncbi:MAG: response regulator transcription factor [Lachnospiraceae bacterium]|nr:response regulator transcription factor [Lachnospiraceae bacterium]